MKNLNFQEFISDISKDDWIFSLKQFLYIYKISSNEFLKISTGDKEKIIFKIEHNIMSSLKIKNPKEYMTILNEQVQEVNFISSNEIKVVIVKERDGN